MLANPTAANGIIAGRNVSNSPGSATIANATPSVTTNPDPKTPATTHPLQDIPLPPSGPT